MPSDEERMLHEFNGGAWNRSDSERAAHRPCEYTGSAHDTCADITSAYTLVPAIAQETIIDYKDAPDSFFQVASEEYGLCREGYTRQLLTDFLGNARSYGDEEKRALMTELQKVVTASRN